MSGSWRYSRAAEHRAARKALLHIQDRMCAGCFFTMNDPAAKYLVVDHDHATGLVRGLLCWTCNQMEAREVLDWEAYVESPPATMTREQCLSSFRARVVIQNQRAQERLLAIWNASISEVIVGYVETRREEVSRAFRRSDEARGLSNMADRIADATTIELSYEPQGDLLDVDISGMVDRLRRYLGNELGDGLKRKRLDELLAPALELAREKARAETARPAPHHWISTRKPGDEPVSEPRCGYPDCPLGWYAHDAPAFRRAMERVRITEDRMESLLGKPAA